MELVRQSVAKPPEKKTKQRKFKRWYFIVIAVVVLIVSIAVSTFILWPEDNIEVPENVKQAAGFNIVQPKSRLKGFEVSKQPRYDFEKNIVITVFKDTSGNTITLSQQQKPENIDLAQIDAADKYLVNAGSVYLLKGEKGKRQSIVETLDTWIYVNADRSLDESIYKKFIQALQPV